MLLRESQWIPHHHVVIEFDLEIGISSQHQDKKVVFLPEGSSRVGDFATLVWFLHLSLKFGVTV